MVDPLSRLAVLNGTDKFGFHDYTPVYHSLLQARRDQSLRMLEIGVGGYGDADRGGESLEVWRDYFPQAQITGIDIQRKIMDLGPRVAILQGSQVDADFLHQVEAARGPFNIILDDGSHRNEHVVETFGLLFEGLVPGGIYIAEDVQTAFMPRFGGSLELQEPNSVGHFAKLLTAIAAGKADQITAVERFHNIVVVHKRDTGGKAPGFADHRGLSESRPTHRLKGAELVDAGALAAVVQRAADGDLIAIEGWPESMQLVHDIFVQIDHREIAVHYPDAPIHPFSARILSLAAYPDGLVLEVGDNSYPSNFTFDYAHPRVAAALQAMDEILASPEARPNGLLQYASMLQRHKGPDVVSGLLDRLAAQGSTERRYYQMAGLRAMRGRRWDQVAALCEEALRHYPGDPHFVATLARAYQTLGHQDKIEPLLREAYRINPRARVVVLALAQIEREAGRLDEAIALYEQSINLFSRPERPAQLAQLVQLCREANRPERAVLACRRWLGLQPDHAEPTAVIRELTPQQHLI